MGLLEMFLRKLDAWRHRRNIDHALALHRRGEVRSDGLVLKTVCNRMEIQWCARDVHPWDRHEPPCARESLFVQQSLADTDAAITRLFEALPQVDVIDVKVLKHPSESPIMAGTVHRSADETDSFLSVKMRLLKRGVKFHLNGSRLEPLDVDHDKDASAPSSELILA